MKCVTVVDSTTHSKPPRSASMWLENAALKKKKKKRATSWTYDSQKVPAAAGFSTCKMASPSNTTASTLVSSCSSVASSRHRTMSDLVPSLSYPLTASDGGYG